MSVLMSRRVYSSPGSTRKLVLYWRLFRVANPSRWLMLRHVALTVTSLEQAQERLREHGVDFRVEDHGNAHSVYLRDPDGHTIELTVYVA